MEHDQQVDSLFACLAHRYRRQIVSIMSKRNDPMMTVELAREIAERVDVNRPAGDVNPVESVEIALHHNHLPKLAETDAIRHDHQGKVIDSTRTTTHLTGLIEIANSIAEER